MFDQLFTQPPSALLELALAIGGAATLTGATLIATRYFMKNSQAQSSSQAAEFNAKTAPNGFNLLGVFLTGLGLTTMIGASAATAWVHPLAATLMFTGVASGFSLLATSWQAERLAAIRAARTTVLRVEPSQSSTNESRKAA